MFMFRKSVEMPSGADAARARQPCRDLGYPFRERRKDDRPSAGLSQAMFGLGCFWGAERYWQLDGVFVTAVDAAGYTKNPTYEEVCTGMTGHNGGVGSV